MPVSDINHEEENKNIKIKVLWQKVLWKRFEFVKFQSTLKLKFSVMFLTDWATLRIL